MNYLLFNKGEAPMRFSLYYNELEEIIYITCDFLNKTIHCSSSKLDFINLMDKDKNGILPSQYFIIELLQQTKQHPSKYILHKYMNDFDHIIDDFIDKLRNLYDSLLDIEF